MEKPAYSIDEIVQIGPLSRSKLYEEIASKRLTARKVGRRTVILAEDFQRYLMSLPAAARVSATVTDAEGTPATWLGDRR